MTRFKPDPLVHPSFYADFEQAPFVTYDVGAAGTLFEIIPGGMGGRSRVVGFEPAPSSYQALIERYARRSDVSIHQVALAEVAGTLTFNLNRSAPTVSSLEERYMHEGEWDRVEVDVLTLDSCQTELDIPGPDFLKADVEGSELRIFQGGREQLAHSVLGVYTEFDFWQRSEQGAKFHEVDKMLSDLGFVLFDLNASRGSSAVGGKKNRLNKGNALYLRDFYSYLEDNRDSSPEALRRKLLGLVVVACSYLYFEYPLELLDLGVKEGLLDASEAQAVQRHLATATDVANRVPEFRNKEKIGAILDYLSWMFHRRSKVSSPPMHNSIGNRPRAVVSHRVPDRVVLSNPVGVRHQVGKIEIDLEDG